MTKPVSAWTENSKRWGLISGYYYFDDYRLDNPYPRDQGGASVPGFNALNLGRGQLSASPRPKPSARPRSTSFRLSVMRNSNNVASLPAA